MTDDEKDRRAMSRDAAKRVHRYVMDNDLPSQVCVDIGILIGRLSLLEGPGWLKDDKDS
jgi:hypothetical protein